MEQIITMLQVVFVILGIVWRGEKILLFALQIAHEIVKIIQTIRKIK